MQRLLLSVTLTSLTFAAPVGATAVSYGGGETALMRIYLGVLLGLAGFLPGTAAVFALLAASFSHPARSKWRQALLGAAVGSVTYLACVVVGSLTLGPLLEAEHPLRPAMARLLEPLAGHVSGEALIVVIFFLPALPVLLWLVWRAHGEPQASRESPRASPDLHRH